MKSKSLLIILGLFMSFFSGGITFSSSQINENPQPLFSLYLLSPSTSPSRNTFAPAMRGELPKIGIQVADLIETGWDVIGPRTFAFPANREGGIPTYENGGYDLFFVGIGNDYDYNPYDTYHKDALSPNGSNFAFYENNEVSILIDDYLTTTDLDTKIGDAFSIQDIITNDLPYIGIAEAGTLWVYNNNNFTLSHNDLLGLSMHNLHDGWKDIQRTSDSRFDYGQPYTFDSISPFESEYGFTTQIQSAVFSTLYEHDSDDQLHTIKPMIAESLPAYSNDRATITIPIRTDINFSNGQSLDIDDVVNSIRMHWTSVSRQFSSELQAAITDPSDIFKDQNNNLIINVNPLYYNSIDLIGSIPIQPEEIIGTWDNPTNGGDFGSDPIQFGISAGPYIFESVDFNAFNVTLIKNPNYWNGNVNNDEIDFLFYSENEIAMADLFEGKLDIIDNNFFINLENIIDNNEINYEIIPDFGTQMISVNMRHPILGTGIDTPLGKSDPNRAEEAARYVRQAISYAIPRDTLVDNVLNGIGFPKVSLWPIESPGYIGDQLNSYKYDLEMAKHMLTLAGYEFSYNSNNSSDSSHKTELEKNIAYPITFSLIALFILMSKKKHIWF